MHYIKNISVLTVLVHALMLCTWYLVWCLDTTAFADNLVFACDVIA